MAHKAGDYLGPTRPLEPERMRLRMLAESLNPGTQRTLARVGIEPGWRCLEIGAAEGSMSRWLADRTAPDGSVVAADLDVRFLAGMESPGVEVRRLDIRVDPLETRHFDLAYCRTLLLHLEDPIAALCRMRDALRAGGTLFVEEPDLCVFETADPDHPEALRFARLHRKLYAALRENKRMDTRFGRTLPGCFESLGLVDVEFEARASLQRGDSPSAHNSLIIIGERIGPPLVDAGALDAEDLECVLELYRDATFEYLSGLQFRVWGRRPDASH